MPYSTDVTKARQLATQAHQGAKDKAGEPYIDHPRRVAERFSTPEFCVVAWLHDVVEDTDVTLEDIRNMFGDDTAAAVDAITHRKGEAWADYICRVKRHPIACQVKIFDLIDNSNLSRLATVTALDVMRQAKYNRALYFLMDVDGI